MNHFGDKVNFIWAVADLLRGPYKPHQYGDVILPLTVLRRLDCVLAPTKAQVLARIETLKGKTFTNAEPILDRVAGQAFHNTSKLDFAKLEADPDHIARNLTHYVQSFSEKARRIIDYFGFGEQITRLNDSNRLYLVVSRFAHIDLHPETVSNTEMGYIFEELIRRFSEAKNEEAGHHFTPREVIRLMVNLLFTPDGQVLTRKGIAPTLYDPTCGTGGMLSVADEFLHELNPDARPQLFGQDFNPESYAICGSDMLIKGQSIDNVKFGDTLGDGKTGDGFPTEKFDYMLSNPPFGVEWKPEEDAVRKEHASLGFNGRFGAGLPRINDGSLLFLQHMISKMKPAAKGGSRFAIVFNGSPLFTGDAGSGESEIRRWVVENDWLEAIVALPDQLFYNTGIFTYVWIVTNRKLPQRRGKVQLVNAVSFFLKMRKSLGNKRNEIGDGRDGKPDQIAAITRLHGDFAEGPHVKIFPTTAFGFRKVTIDRPLRLRFEVTPSGLEALRETGAFQNLAKSKKKDKKVAAAEEADGLAHQLALVEVLEALPCGKAWTDRADFLAELAETARVRQVKIPAPVRKAIVASLGERDDGAAICLDDSGEPEPDPELRDFENVPLTEEVQAYFDREVRPHVPDAWINTAVRDEKDGQVGKVGYEIPLTRHFYVYQPPRPLHEIEADIAALEKDIVRMLREVVG